MARWTGSVQLSRAWSSRTSDQITKGAATSTDTSGCGTRASPEKIRLVRVVVVLQVVSSAMRWSSRRPFAVDLRSARATPAPPLVMVGYSTKLAVTTTLTSLVFSALARVPHPEVSLLVASPFLVWSMVRLLHARDAWTDPVRRATVVTTVAG